MFLALFSAVLSVLFFAPGGLLASDISQAQAADATLHWWIQGDTTTQDAQTGLFGKAELNVQNDAPVTWTADAVNSEESGRVYLVGAAAEGEATDDTVTGSDGKQYQRSTAYEILNWGAAKGTLTGSDTQAGYTAKTASAGLGFFTAARNVPWHNGYYDEITDLALGKSDSTLRLPNIGFWFADFTMLKEADFRYIDNTNGKSVVALWCRCAFLNNKGIERIRLGRARAYLTSQATNSATATQGAYGLCQGCTNLQEATFDYGGTSTDCEESEKSERKASRLTNTSFTTQGMFTGCESLRRFDLTSVPVISLGDSRSAFDGCSSITEILFPTAYWDHSYCSYAFRNCFALQTLQMDMRSNSNWSNGLAVFQNCRSLKTQPKIHFTSLNSDGGALAYAFDGCSSLESIDLSDCTWNASGTSGDNGRAMNGIFRNCSALREVKLPETFAYGGESRRMTSLYALFSGCTSLTSIDFGGLTDTAKIQDYRDVFKGCANLTSLDLSRFSASSATSMSGFLEGCYSLNDFTLGKDFVWSTADANKPVFPIGAGDYKWYGYNDVEGWSDEPACTEAGTPLPKGSGRFRVKSEDAVPSTSVFYRVSEVADSSLNTEQFITPEYAGPFYKLEISGSRLAGLGTVSSGAFMNREVWATKKNQPWANYTDHVVSVDIDASISNARLLSGAYWFAGMGELLEANGLGALDTSQAATVKAMFQGCSRLAAADVADLNLGACADFSYIFDGCGSLPSLDVRTWDVGNGTDLTAAFRGCASLSTLDVSHWDTSSATSASRTFDACSSLSSIDVSGWDVSSMKDLSSMFASCSRLSRLELWNDSKTTAARNLSGMFSGCGLLESVNLSRVDTSGAANLSNMFADCYALSKLDLSTFDTGKATNLANMFNNDSALSELKVGTTFTWSFNGPAFPVSNNAYHWYVGGDENKPASTSAGTFVPSGVKATYTSNSTAVVSKWVYWSIDSATETLHVAGDGNGARAGWARFPAQLGEPDDAQVTPAWKDAVSMGATVKTVSIESQVEPYAVNSWFSNLADLTEVTGLSRIATTALHDASNLFANDSKLESIDDGYKNLVGSEVENVSGMFNGCALLATPLDVSNWKTGNVTNMSSLFKNCSATTLTGFESWDVSSLKNCASMFQNTSLKNVDLSKWAMSNVESMAYMFDENKTLVTVALPTCAMPALSSISYIFYGCRLLEDSNLFRTMAYGNDTLRVFDTSNVRDMSYVLCGCNSLRTPEQDVTYTDRVIVTKTDAEGKEYTTGEDRDVTETLKVLPIEFDTSSATDMSGMFHGLSCADVLDVTGFNTSDVWNMELMFGYMDVKLLKGIEDFDVRKVSNMRQLFRGSTNLKRLDLKTWKTDSLTDAWCIFFTMYPNVSLTYLDLSSFDTTRWASLYSSYFNVLLARGGKAVFGEHIVGPGYDAGSHQWIVSACSYDSKETYSGFWMELGDTVQYVNGKWMTLYGRGERTVFYNGDKGFRPDTGDEDTVVVDGNSENSGYTVHFDPQGLPCTFSDQTFATGAKAQPLRTEATPLSGKGDAFEGVTLDGWSFTKGTNECVFSRARGALYWEGNTTGTVGSVSCLTGGSDITLYAKWHYNDYSVTFDANTGSSSATATQEMLYANSLSLTAYDELAAADAGFARDGYVFTGWNTEADGSGTAFADTQAVSGSSFPAGSGADRGAVTLYAQWAPANFNLKFNANYPGQTVGNSATKMSVAYANPVDESDPDDPVELSQNLPSADALGFTASAPAGYTFRGWSLDKNAEAATWQNCSAVTGKGLMDSAAAWAEKQTGTAPEEPVTSGTLYAVWSYNAYTVKYNANATGTTGTMADTVAVYNSATKLRKNTFARSGYTFAGWNTVANPTDANPGTAYADEAKTTKMTRGSEVTLYAQWAANSTSITFNANGGSGSMATQTVTYGTYSYLTKNTFTRAGYTFDGWNTVASPSDENPGVAYRDGAAVNELTLASAVPLYAQWRPSAYTVTFNANATTGTTGTMAAQSVPYNTKTSLTSNAFTRTGYVFMGWNSAADGTGTAYADGEELRLTTDNVPESTSGTEFTLYAQWQASTTAFKYHSNYGSDVTIDGTAIAQSATLKTAAQAANTSAGGNAAFARTGYSLLSWNTRADGKGTAYVPGSTVASGLTADLYAVYKPLAYTVNFNANTASGATGVEGTTASITANYGQIFTAPACGTTWAGHVFTGWSSVASPTKATPGVTMSAGAPATVDAAVSANSTTVTFYAQWKDAITLAAPADRVYDGASHVELAAGSGYTLTKANLDGYASPTFTAAGATTTAAGDYAVKVTADNNAVLLSSAEGVLGDGTEAVLTWSVSKVPVKADMIGAIADQVWAGANVAVEPDPVVRYNGTRLTKGVDYTLSYENNALANEPAAGAPAEAFVKVTGMGNYKGWQTVKFKITATPTAAAIAAALGGLNVNGYSTWTTAGVNVGSGSSAQTLSLDEVQARLEAALAVYETLSNANKANVSSSTGTTVANIVAAEAKVAQLQVDAAKAAKEAKAEQEAAAQAAKEAKATAEAAAAAAQKEAKEAEDAQAKAAAEAKAAEQQAKAEEEAAKAEAAEKAAAEAAAAQAAAEKAAAEAAANASSAAESASAQMTEAEKNAVNSAVSSATAAAATAGTSDIDTDKPLTDESNKDAVAKAAESLSSLTDEQKAAMTPQQQQEIANVLAADSANKQSDLAEAQKAADEAADAAAMAAADEERARTAAQSAKAAYEGDPTDETKKEAYEDAVAALSSAIADNEAKSAAANEAAEAAAEAEADAAKSYSNLSDTQKAAVVDAAKGTGDAAKAAQAVLEADYTNTLNEVGSDPADLASADPAEVAAIVTAYDRLTDSQKAALAGNEAAAAAIANVRAADTDNKLDALASATSETDKTAALTAASTAYDKLTDEQKDALAEQAASGTGNAEAIKAVLDADAAAKTTAAATNLNDTSPAAKASVAAAADAIARTGKTELSTSEQAIVNKDASNKVAALTDATNVSDEQLAEALEAYERADAATQTQLASNSVIAKALAADASAKIAAVANAQSDEERAEAVAEAAAAYAKLTDTQKATLAEQNATGAASEGMAAVVVADLSAKAAELGDVTEIDTNNAVAVAAALTAYANLSDEQREELAKTDSGAKLAELASTPAGQVVVATAEANAAADEAKKLSEGLSESSTPAQVAAAKEAVAAAEAKAAAATQAVEALGTDVPAALASTVEQAEAVKTTASGSATTLTSKETTIAATENGAKVLAAADAIVAADEAAEAAETAAKAQAAIDAAIAEGTAPTTAQIIAAKAAADEAAAKAAAASTKLDTAVAARADTLDSATAAALDAAESTVAKTEKAAETATESVTAGKQAAGNDVAKAVDAAVAASAAAKAADEADAAAEAAKAAVAELEKLPSNASAEEKAAAEKKAADALAAAATAADAAANAAASAQVAVDGLSAEQKASLPAGTEKAVADAAATVTEATSSVSDLKDSDSVKNNESVKAATEAAEKTAKAEAAVAAAKQAADEAAAAAKAASASDATASDIAAAKVAADKAAAAASAAQTAINATSDSEKSTLTSALSEATSTNEASKSAADAAYSGMSTDEKAAADALVKVAAAKAAAEELAAVNAAGGEPTAQQLEDAAVAAEAAQKALAELSDEAKATLDEDELADATSSTDAAARSVDASSERAAGDAAATLAATKVVDEAKQAAEAAKKAADELGDTPTAAQIAAAERLAAEAAEKAAAADKAVSDLGDKASNTLKGDVSTAKDNASTASNTTSTALSNASADVKNAVEAINTAEAAATAADEAAAAQAVVDAAIKAGNTPTAAQMAAAQQAADKAAEAAAASSIAAAKVPANTDEATANALKDAKTKADAAYSTAAAATDSVKAAKEQAGDAAANAAEALSAAAAAQAAADEAKTLADELAATDNPTAAQVTAAAKAAAVAEAKALAAQDAVRALSDEQKQDMSATLDAVSKAAKAAENATKAVEDAKAGVDAAVAAEVEAAVAAENAQKAAYEAAKSAEAAAAAVAKANSDDATAADKKAAAEKIAAAQLAADAASEAVSAAETAAKDLGEDSEAAKAAAAAKSSAQTAASTQKDAEKDAGTNIVAAAGAVKAAEQAAEANTAAARAAEAAAAAVAKANSDDATAADKQAAVDALAAAKAAAETAADAASKASDAAAKQADNDALPAATTNAAAKAEKAAEQAAESVEASKESASDDVTDAADAVIAVADAAKAAEAAEAAAKAAEEAAKSGSDAAEIVAALAEAQKAADKAAAAAKAAEKAMDTLSDEAKAAVSDSAAEAADKAQEAAADAAKAVKDVKDDNKGAAAAADAAIAAEEAAAKAEAAEKAAQTAADAVADAQAIAEAETGTQVTLSDGTKVTVTDEAKQQAAADAAEAIAAADKAADSAKQAAEAAADAIDDLGDKWKDALPEGTEDVVSDAADAADKAAEAVTDTKDAAGEDITNAASAATAAEKAAAATDALIDALPNAKSISADPVAAYDAIKAARAAYDELTDAAKAKVSGLAVLEAAEKAYKRAMPSDLANATVTLAQTSYTWTGKALTPAVKSVTIVIDGETKTLEASDYTVAYANNVRPGTATVTLTGTGTPGKGGYSGTAKASFRINAASSVTVGGFAYKLSGANATLTKGANLTKVAVPATIPANGTNYKVTSVGASAFAKMTKVTTVTIGKNVTSIGKQAFNGCKKLKTVNAKAATGLKSVGKKAFTGAKKNMKFQVAKKVKKKIAKKYKSYGLKKKSQVK